MVLESFPFIKIQLFMFFLKPKKNPKLNPRKNRNFVIFDENMGM